MSVTINLYEEMVALTNASENLIKKLFHFKEVKISEHTKAKIIKVLLDDDFKNNTYVK